MTITQNSIMTDLRVGSKYRIQKKIGGGSFGEIYHGEHVVTHEVVAIKLESIDTRPPQLLFESKVYNILAGGVGVPSVKWYGIEGDYNVMVMDLMGQSLEKLFNDCQHIFTLKTVLMIADQLITRIEYMHAKGFIHRDIKPENFVIGTENTSNVIYVIDFGLSKKYRDPKTLEHIPFKDGKSLTGTARYVSINTHNGKEQSRRDDLESIAYLLIYFLKGKLPWQGLGEKTRQKKYQMIGEMKTKIDMDVLFEDCPDEFRQFLVEVKALDFTEEPKYAHYRELFRNLFISKGYCYDYKFDWVLRAEQNGNVSHNYSRSEEKSSVPNAKTTDQRNPVSTPLVRMAVQPFIKKQSSAMSIGGLKGAKEEQVHMENYQIPRPDFS